MMDEESQFDQDDVYYPTDRQEANEGADELSSDGEIEDSQCWPEERGVEPDSDLWCRQEPDPNTGFRERLASRMDDDFYSCIDGADDPQQGQQQRKPPPVFPAASTAEHAKTELPLTAIDSIEKSEFSEVAIPAQENDAAPVSEFSEIAKPVAVAALSSPTESVSNEDPFAASPPRRLEGSFMPLGPFVPFASLGVPVIPQQQQQSQQEEEAEFPPSPREELPVEPVPAVTMYPTLDVDVSSTASSPVENEAKLPSPSAPVLSAVETVEASLPLPAASPSRVEYVKSDGAFTMIADRFLSGESYVPQLKGTPVLTIKCIPQLLGEPRAGRQGEAGRDGQNGISGAPGENAAFGNIGQQGANGTNGHDGTDGLRGLDGENGRDALPAYVRLDGTAGDLQVTGSIKINSLSLGNDGFIFVDARGGAGAHGGAGGKGGRGGNGGDGGAGGAGGNAQIASQTGGEGGRGGDGGRGGKGGNGGDGGNGGSGGSGSKVIIESSDPRLFVLVDADTQGGASGKGGKPGAAGQSGVSGRGGAGGPGGQGFNKRRDGEPGMNGSDGPGPFQGNWGKEGRPGAEGTPGSLCFVVSDPNNPSRILERGCKRYNLQIVGYKIKGIDLDDGILEPGERVQIEDICLRNDGDISLPRGCLLRLQPSPSLLLDQQHGTNTAQIILPEIAPHSQRTLSASDDYFLRGKLRAVEPAYGIQLNRALVPQTARLVPSDLASLSQQQLLDIMKQEQLHLLNASSGASMRFKSQLDLSLSCQLLQREMLPQQQSHATFDIEYPIHVEKLHSKQVMSPGETSTFKVEFSNISRATYGGIGSGSAATPTSPQQQYQYRIYFFDGFKPIVSSSLGASVSSMDKGVTVVQGTLPSIAPNSTSTITFQVQTRDNLTDFFNRIAWRVELVHPSGSSIELKEAWVRLCPRFSSFDPTRSDVLLVTNPFVSRTEFILYTRLFEGLGLANPSVYDVELEEEKPSQLPAWSDKFLGKPVVFLLNPKDPLSDISSGRLNVQAIMRHFGGQNSVDSGLVLVGNGSSSGGMSQDHSFRELLFDRLYAHPSVWHQELSQNEFSDNFFKSEPSRDFMQQKMRDIAAAKSAEKPSHLFKVYATYDPRKISSYFAYPSVYTYGKAILKQLPLNRIQRLLFLQQQGHPNQGLSTGLSPDTLYNLIIMGQSPISIDSDTNFFETALAVMSAMSLEHKLEMLLRSRRLPSVQQDWHFILRESSSSTETPVHDQQPSDEQAAAGGGGFLGMMKQAWSAAANAAATAKAAASPSSSASNRKVSLPELIRTVLYDDLKREYFLKDQGLGRVQRLIDVVKTRRIEFLQPDHVYSIWQLLSRITSNTFWRSMPFLSELTEKRKQLLEIVKSFEEQDFNFSHSDTKNGPSAITVVRSKLAPNGEKISVDEDAAVNVNFDLLQSAKMSAARDAQDRSRLKLQDLTKRLVFPLELAD